MADRFSDIVSGLVNCGYAVADDFLPQEVISRMANETVELWQQGGFRHARVGQGDQKAKHPEIRNDRIHWLEPLELSEVQKQYFDQLEQLRLAINWDLFLGLFEFEGHLALYPPGSFYGKHLDCFQESNHRVVTCILYLNESWQQDDGGLLRIYLDDDGNESNYLDIEPLAGRLVVFLSRRFYHEVLPANQDRLSLTGWFRVRPLQGEGQALFIADS